MANERLVADMTELARQNGSYGYRRVAVLLRDSGWQASDGLIERRWRREGLKVPPKQQKKGRLWRNDGACIRLRPEYRNHVWSYVRALPNRRWESAPHTEQLG